MNVQSLALRQGGDERRACFALVDEADLQAASAQPEALLGAAELARFCTLRFPLKRQGFLLGRLAAKQALGALLDETDLRNIEIHPGIFGQPLVHHPRAARVEVSVSHSHGLAVALAHPGEFPMGVDLESVSTDSAATILGELQASDAEKAWLAEQAQKAQRALGEAAACGVLWTAREALGKSMQIGLNCPLGILALKRLEPAGANAWIGQYANFPQSRCLSQTLGARALSVALPLALELAPWPLLG